MDNLEQTRLICKHCEKTIAYERPLFCPFCGTKIDPVDGLEALDTEMKVYKWAGIAPLLVQICVAWLILLLPVARIFGRNGVAVLSLLFAGFCLGLIVLSIFNQHSLRRFDQVRGEKAD